MNSLFAYSKSYQYAVTLLFLLPLVSISQYTDVINSNRPGVSVSAYAVGKNVVQAEVGLFYEQQDHTLLNTESNIWGTDISLRYGLLFEKLELNYEGTFQDQNTTYLNFDVVAKRRDFSRNRLGLKFLVYDPFKNPEANKPNLYSWRANNKFQFKNLLPAISIYGGANFVLGDNPFYIGEPTVSYRGMIATQSRLTPRFVLITNTAFDRISTDDPELSYTISLSHAFRNPKWSVFAEHQGIDSDRYSDLLIRGGIAHLLKENLQLDFNMGASLKNTPTRIFFGIGGSYRLDFHKDSLKPIEDQEANQNGGAINKKAMKKKKKGSGAEDIDLGPSKRQLKKLRKAEKKKKKESSEIDF
ncbi:transporter [Maribacter ulvicola]|uniref:Putative MetA-pathway of phenol degradation n=1 Tax=Maribacter ulvicola TaxID=228959 RepID=A0A1N6VBI3_9FLAO|nr:transporter [Maribacter ulvicola]SIQ75127.1 Putative MetA-pathway of phenol degradation [Maribacter ulvicola]